ncbi:cation transport protein-domain-containing protein [Camillea tinctor]|nr:cation transport protein-domain-containing protein [Camillea tinctor]
MLSLLDHVWGFIKAIRPSFMSRNPHFNFITVHYFWIIGWAIVGSVLVYATAEGKVAYIDALFFSVGANTQAGLNPIDTNLLNTFQQIVLYLMFLVSNPITINSFVVFLRLYWFEKRFQHIAKEARSRRVTITKSRSKAKAIASDIERGVNGRNITVMHNTAKASRMTNDGIVLEERLFDNNNPGKLDPLSTTSQSESSSDHVAIGEQPRLPTPQIKFSDQVRRSDAIVDSDDEDDHIPLPRKRPDEDHIAILERQRKADKADKSVLRIPGPRDADQGALPEEVEEDEVGVGPEMSNRKRRESSIEAPGQTRLRRISSPPPPPRSPTGHDRQPTITIEEPIRPWRREEMSRHEGISERISEDVEAAAHAAGAVRFRKPRSEGEKLHTTETTTSSVSPRANPLQRIRTALTQNKDEDPMPYLSWQPTLGRNSAFLDMTEEQREELGGIEYRSLKTLAVVLTCYFWGYHIFGIITLVPWIVHNNPQYGDVVDKSGVARVWWGFWTSSSAFMDVGFTLTADSMNSFNTAVFPLLIMSFLIILGNTGFPIMLRFMIWLTSLVVPKGSGLWEELRFLLDHPRRCFTLLFPANATWWLFFILVVLNGLDLILFIILDLGSGAVAELPLHIRFLNGWFQATSTRTAGFSCINLSLVHPAVQTAYLVMMYISVFPVAISIRRTNVYEEKSLGMYGTAHDFDDNEGSMSYVGTHLRRQLSFDLWYIFIGYFILTISEGSRLMTQDFSMFSVLFEVVSAYGTVGLSLGYPTVNASLSSQFTVIGKLVIISMQIRGRHRGLPYGLDRAILLPSENLNRKEAEDAELRLQRRQSAVSVGNLPAPVRSQTRGRSRSVDKRRVITGLLHPGPSYLHHSTTKSDFSMGLGKSDTLRRYTSGPTHEENSEI